ncbi:MAG TPA: sugar phosphate nucleotidyltransferase [Candidatus Dormibacteraeota bacterium]|nr:sugar phosphate nucleotidyltransferase [Candidatus Dormibacteraeota bacterium]
MGTRAPARFAVIMAGGAGTRFWPLSRAARPKQFLHLAGRGTMLQETARRLRGVVPRERVLVVAPPAHVRLVRAQLPWLAADNLIVEPAPRGTAACLALVAAQVARRAPDAALVVLAADHAISDVAALRVCLRRAFAVADDGWLVTFGIPPTRPETGYGYVRVGAPLDRARPRAARALRFVEKPEARTARRFVAAGDYRWNSGMFAWRVDAFRAALARYEPAIAAAADAVAERGGAAARRAYGRLPSQPIDVALLEHARRIAVVDATFDWSDVGSWAAMAELWGTDGAGNARRGRALLLDCRDTIVQAGSRLVAVLGAEDLVVVDTPDALLVCPRTRAQEVRAVVAALARGSTRRLI